MVKNEQNLHFKHPLGELAVDGVVKKFTIKKGVSTNMARKSKGSIYPNSRGNERVERNLDQCGKVHNLATHHEYLEHVRTLLEVLDVSKPSEVTLSISIKWDDDKEVDSRDPK